ncbi:LysM peptidoglycan-binding domain-containing protein [Lysinibacillus odysseyi]|uniref:Peptidoglycan hydrolase n=1 Tax=Lysinibacillus odysseyi 34hs-1 = NBRC 100172 TaxID=1220589 RepID=A0A0A3IGA9_9BACI|nr:C40 family peptidase [Lysinibacillus odysseyi]KGR83776.1 hypothetical protein CD32_13815 [Lysinibacillus odysseyi 34hs-1 = NBRC 100172]
MRKWQIILASVVMTSMLAAPIAHASTYTVQKGDTLSKIALANGTTVASLKQWNNLQQDTIFVSQKLIVTKEQSTGGQTSKLPIVATTVPAIKPSAVSSKIYTYIVEKGDNLTKVASKNNTTIAKLKEWNGLSSDVIYVNQTLIIKKEELTSAGTVVTLPSTNPPADSQQPAMSNADKEIAAQLAAEKKITVQPSAASQEKYKKAIETAYSLIGTPYIYGGNTTSGFDCSGFVKYVYTNAMVNVSRKSSLDYFMNDTTVVANPVPGDVVFFKNTYIPTISHMGIYIGNNQFIHAGSNGVEVSSLSYSYWDTRFVAFKRFNQIQ